jgi:predicted porin
MKLPLYASLRPGKGNICFALFFAMSAVPGLFSGLAWGEDFDIIPSISIKEEYNDNVYFSTAPRVRAFLTVISPKLELVKKDERTDAALSTRLSEIIDSEHKGHVVTAFNQDYQGRASYLLDPRWQLSLTAGYTIDNRPSSSVEKDGIVINALRRDNQAYSVGTSYALTEKSTASLSYLYQQEDFSGQPKSDNRTHAAGVAFVHDLRKYLPDSQGSAGFNFSRFEFADSTTNNYSATIGMNWAFSETWTFAANLGGRYTDTDSSVLAVSPLQQPVGIVTQSNSGWGLVGNASISVRGEVNNGSLTLKHDMAAAPSRTGAAETTSIGLSYQHSFTPKFTTSTGLVYQLSNSNGDGTAATRIDEEFIQFNTNLRYEFTRNMAVETAYSYAKAIYNQNNTTTDRNSILVSLTIRHPYFDQW